MIDDLRQLIHETQQKLGKGLFIYGILMDFDDHQMLMHEAQTRSWKYVPCPFDIKEGTFDGFKVIRSREAMTPKIIIH
jgi:hypothetical protein